MRAFARIRPRRSKVTGQPVRLTNLRKTLREQDSPACAFVRSLGLAPRNRRASSRRTHFSGAAELEYETGDGGHTSRRHSPSNRTFWPGRTP